MNPPDSTSLPYTSESLLEPDFSIPGMRITAARPDDGGDLLIRTAAAQPNWIIEPQTLADRISIKEVPTLIITAADTI